MSSMNRVRVTWSGGAGGAGVSTFYLSDSTVDMTALKAFFQAMNVYVPTGITWSIPFLGDKINSDDGSLVGAWNGTNGGSVSTLGGTTGYAGSAGFCVDWKTNVPVAGRRRMGRTFFVPGASGLWQNNGSIADSTVTAIASAANTMVSAYAGNLLVWSRPYPGRAQSGTPGQPGYKPAKPARTGSAVPVLLATVPDLAVVLRSRRS
jgi:hypothetical protein